MKLLSIQIQNFRLHADTSINFEAEGITAIVGSNESGKSTILEAILWAFFGGDAIRGTKEGLRWFRAPERQPASVSLAFVLKGQKYVLVRSEATATLASMMATESTGGAILAEGTKPVNEFIPKLLGLSLNEFTASFMVKQKDVARIATMLPTERQTFIREVLGVGKLDDALKACRKSKNELAQQIVGMKIGLGEKEPLEAADKLANEERLAAVEFLTTAVSEVAAAADTERVATVAYMGFEEAKERDAALMRDIEGAKQDGNRAAEGRGRLQDVLDRMDLWKQELAEATAFPALQELKNKLKETQDAGLEATARGTKARMLRLADQASHRSALVGFTSEAAELNDLISGISDLGAEAGCPTCTVPLGDNYQRVLDGLFAQADAIKIKGDEHSAAIATLNDLTPYELTAQTQAADFLALLHDQGRVLEGAEKRDRELAEIRGKIAEEEQTKKSLAVLDTELKGAIKAASDLEETRKLLAFDAGVYMKAKVAAEGATQDHQRALITKAKADSAVMSANDQAATALRAVKNYEFRSEALKDVEAYQLNHERAAARLADFRTAVAGTIRPELEELMSGFVHLLTDGRHEAVELTEDFTAILHESGIAVEVISGGCEDIAALAMRLSISQMIAERAGHPLSLLILDEPFGSQDENRRGNILNLLRVLSGVFSQVIVISHIAETRDNADHIIELEFDEMAGCTRISA